jgi:hypothetical protein
MHACPSPRVPRKGLTPALLRRAKGWSRVEAEEQHLDRRVRNEMLFRTVNEKLRGLNAEFEAFADERALFVCECSRIDCIEQIELAVADFDEICLMPNRYMVIPGHETLDVETVVTREAGYLVVEKMAAV